MRKQIFPRPERTLGSRSSVPRLKAVQTNSGLNTHMNTQTIENQFARMGARFQVVHQETTRRDADYALDIRADRRGQYFELRVPASVERSLEVAVLQVQPQERHLVLLVKKPAAKDRFLCGHDEREWFVAAVPGTATTVMQAREALKPQFIRLEETRRGLRARERARRRNAVAIRQGEWFFVPMPEMVVKTPLIFRNEPIRRGAGKPHLVAEVYRDGGENVLVCPHHPNGLTEAAYHTLLARKPKAKGWGWIRMRRNARVYARGPVRHPDHATITLPCWHEVLMNTETLSRTMANVAFLD